MAVDPLLARIASTGAKDAPGAAPASRPTPKGSPAFGAVLDEQTRLTFSSHAEKRLNARDIRLDPPQVQRLAEAVTLAGQKGGRESLILMDDLAFIVDVQNRVVVTAVNPERRKEGVFTNIDSVVLAK